MAFFDEAFCEDRRIDGDVNDNDDGIVAETDACVLDMPIVLGHGPNRDVVNVSEVAVAFGVVVTAAFGSRGTI